MTHRHRVVVADYLADADLERVVLDAHADVECLMARDEPELASRAADADAMLLFHDMRLTAESLGKLDRLRGVVRVGVGYDNVDLSAASSRGVVICNVPDYGTEDVADHAILMLLAIARRLVPSVDSIREGRWDPLVVRGAPRLRGKTLGIIGCGRIGTAAALRAKALGMSVVFYDPYVAPGYEKALGVDRSYCLREMLAESDFLSLHCPLTVETLHLLDFETIALLPKGAYIINTARGPCINAEALLVALDSGQISFAALDVLEREPLDDDRLRRHPRVLLTPHTAYYSVEGFTEMRMKAAEEIKRMLTGEPVRNPVNLHLLSGAARCVLPPSGAPEAGIRR